MTLRPCATSEPFHKNPADTAATCRLCYHALHTPYFRRLWGEPSQERPCKAQHPNPFHHAKNGKSKGACHTCWLALHSEEHRILWDEPPLSYWTPEGQKAARESEGEIDYGLCIHRGRTLQPPAVPSDGRQWVACGHDLIPLEMVPVCACSGIPEDSRCGSACPGYLGEKEENHDTRILKFDEYNLHRGFPGKRFNSSIIEWGDGYLMAWRHGWSGCEIYLTVMDSKFHPRGEPIKLNLDHPEARYGREDPRLFMFRGRLHVTYVGVMPHPDNNQTFGLTRMFYARLSNSLRVEQVFCLPKFNEREKNWSPFVCDNELFFSYSYTPHRVLRVEGERATWAFETPTPAPWNPGSEIRGGSPGILIDEEFWVLFHAKRDMQRGEPHYTPNSPWYHVGVLTHSARPPFRVTRITPDPILWADPATNRNTIRHPRNYAPVVFPCGSVLKSDDWQVSMGIHDRWTEIHKFSRQRIESRMVQLAPPGWWSQHHDENERNDWGIWESVVRQDEYRLAQLDLKGASILDVGGHVGCFAFAARQRGARLIHCYEPVADNYRHLDANAKRLGNVQAFPVAVGLTAGRGRLPDVSEVEHSAGWSVIADESGDVPVVGLDEAITRLASASPTGRIELLKIDCEGGEVPSFLGATRLDLVDKIVGEWHRYFYDGKFWEKDDIARLVTSHGFEVEVCPPAPNATWGLFFARRK